MDLESSVIMNWIAGWLPLLCLVVTFVIYYFWKSGWAVLITSVLSFGVPLLLMLSIFSMTFWPWLMLYVFLSWFACWAANFALKWKSHRQNQQSSP